jgi:outer membrane beta-barrel protein
MRRIALGLAALCATIGMGTLAAAQEEPAPPTTEEPTPSGPPQPTAPSTPETAEKPAAAPGARTFSDVVVVPRKAVLKGGRIELAPFVGATINDPLIQHFAFGGQLNYFFSDAFGVGLEGMLYEKHITDRGNLIGLQYYRVPTMNEMKWAAALNFTYVPIYGKFALFNKNIVHWEAVAIGGVGITHTAIIPRNPSDAIFENDDITPNLGIGGRVFVNDWLSIWFNLRDYIYPDNFEATNRMGGTAEQAKAQASSQIINNVVLALGASFFLPPSFRYHSPR